MKNNNQRELSPVMKKDSTNSAAEKRGDAVPLFHRKLSFSKVSPEFHFDKLVGGTLTNHLLCGRKLLSYDSRVLLIVPRGWRGGDSRSGASSPSRERRSSWTKDMGALTGWGTLVIKKKGLERPQAGRRPWVKRLKRTDSADFKPRGNRSEGKVFEEASEGKF